MLLRHAWYGLNQAFRRRLAGLDLTPDQFTVLRTLWEHPGVSQKSLATLMASDPNTIASLVERMERTGLVERKRRPLDRRVFSLRLRPEGRRKYKAGRVIASNLQAEVLQAFTDTEQEWFLDRLATIAQACQAASHSHPVGKIEA